MFSVVTYIVYCVMWSVVSIVTYIHVAECYVMSGCDFVTMYVCIIFCEVFISTHFEFPYFSSKILTFPSPLAQYKNIQPPIVVIGPVIHQKSMLVSVSTVPCQVVTRVSCYLVTTVTVARADDRGGPAPPHHPLIWTLLLPTNCW